MRFLQSRQNPGELLLHISGVFEIGNVLLCLLDCIARLFELPGRERLRRAGHGLLGGLSALDVLWCGSSNAARRQQRGRCECSDKTSRKNRPHGAAPGPTVERTAFELQFEHPARV